MRMRVMAAVGALAVAGSVLAVGAQEARERRQTGERPDPAALRAELGLSDEQAAQMQKMRADGRKEAIRSRADLAVARIELEELMNAPAVDQKAIDAKVKAIADLQAAQLKARVDQRLALRRLLSPEQQEKMKQLQQQRRGPRPAGAWRERRPGQAGAPIPPPAPGGPWSDLGDEPVTTEPER